MNTIIRAAAAAMLLALASACSESSQPSWTPPPIPAGSPQPKFTVISLDVRFQAPPPPRGPCGPDLSPFERYQNGCANSYQVIAHGMFRNDGAPGHASVIFSVAELGTQCEAFLTDMTTKADLIATGATADASCSVGTTNVLAQYKVTVVAIQPF